MHTSAYTKRLITNLLQLVLTTLLVKDSIKLTTTSSQVLKKTDPLIAEGTPVWPPLILSKVHLPYKLTRMIL